MTFLTDSVTVNMPRRTDFTGRRRRCHSEITVRWRALPEFPFDPQPTTRTALSGSHLVSPAAAGEADSHCGLPRLRLRVKRIVFSCMKPLQRHGQCHDEFCVFREPVAVLKPPSETVLQQNREGVVVSTADRFLRHRELRIYEKSVYNLHGFDSLQAHTPTERPSVSGESGGLNLSDR